MSLLLFIEQPSSTFRYRYKSELHGAHGHISGETSLRSNKTLPAVVLVNPPEPTAIIRCTLSAADADSQHPHLLVNKTKTGLEKEPHILMISEENGFRADFKVGIIQTAKKDAVAVLKEKYQGIWKRNAGNKKLVSKQCCEINKRAESEARSVDLNTVRLRFEALHGNGTPIHDEFGKPLVIFSNKISNSKCAANGDLSISESSRSTGSCNGGDHVMLFVSKVDKKNIQIRFFEEDENGDLIWEDFAKFSENNVHHQYGISFETPAYRNKNISSDVEVFYQLVRPKDKACSELKTFIYHPCDYPYSKKRKMNAPEDLHEELSQVNPCTTPSFERFLQSGDDMVTSSNVYSPVQETANLNGSNEPDYILPDASIEDVLNIGDLCGEEFINSFMGKQIFDSDGHSLKRPAMVKRSIKTRLQQQVWSTVAFGDDSDLSEMLSDQHLQEAKRLLEAFPENGLAAIHQAARRGNLAMLTLVLERGVNASAVDRCAGRTALHLAIQGGHEEVVKHLVQEVSDIIDFTDWKGQTSLHYAIIAAQRRPSALKLCELLLDAEADPETCDLEGVSPLELACGNRELEKLLEKYVDDLGKKFSQLRLKVEDGDDDE